MTFAILETTAHYRSTFKTFDSFAGAVEFAKANFPIVAFEQDGEAAADFITKFGVVYEIEAI